MGLDLIAWTRLEDKMSGSRRRRRRRVGKCLKKYFTILLQFCLVHGSIVSGYFARKSLDIK